MTPTNNERKLSTKDSPGLVTIKDWLDCVERVLAAQSELAGVLQHAGEIGNAREFFVRNVLARLLPPTVHVGTGQVIGSVKGPSKQIDVILYDSRLPILELDVGTGLYLAEGVIAAIEVKSTLDRARLHTALDNCYSEAIRKLI